MLQGFAGFRRALHANGVGLPKSVSFKGLGMRGLSLFTASDLGCKGLRLSVMRLELTPYIFVELIQGSGTLGLGAEVVVFIILNSY